MKHRLVLMCCTVFSCCLLFAQVPNKKIIPFQHGEDTLYFLSVSIALPDTIYLQLSNSIDGVATEANRMQWQTFIENVTKELNCLREKGAPEQEVLKLEERIRKLERNLRWGIAEKMIGRDELVFTVLVKRMFKRISDQELAPEKVVLLFNQVKMFYDGYVAAIDESAMPDSIQDKVNKLKLQISKLNDSIEGKSGLITQLRIQKRFRRWNPALGRKDSLLDTGKNSSEKVNKKEKKLQFPIQNVDDLDAAILLARAERKKTVSRRQGIARKIRDYKAYHANPSLHLTGNALSYLENQEPTTTTGIGIYSRKADLWEFSMYMTVSQTKDMLSANFDDREVFGNALLVPGVRKYSLLTSYRSNSLHPFSTSRFLQKLGFGWNLNLTPMTWEITSVQDMKDKKLKDTHGQALNYGQKITSQVIPFSSDLFLSFNWLTSKSKNRAIGKEFRVSTDFGVTCRYLFGDLAQKAGWIEQFLDSRRRFFPGIYLGINVAIDNLQIFFNGPILLGDKVEGLSYGQTVANIGLRGKLFNIGNNE